jgi:hypothetical protein
VGVLGILGILGIGEFLGGNFQWNKFREFGEGGIEIIVGNVRIWECGNTYIYRIGTYLQQGVYGDVSSLCEREPLSEGTHHRAHHLCMCICMCIYVYVYVYMYMYMYICI